MLYAAQVGEGLIRNKPCRHPLFCKYGNSAKLLHFVVVKVLYN